MAFLILPSSDVVVFDDEDEEKILAFKWYKKPGHSGNVYAVCVRPYQLMHRLIVGLENHDGKIVDHINHNGLDNTRKNLRVVSNAVNMANRRGPSRNSTSGIRGVYWYKRDKKWCADIQVLGKTYHIGRFKTIEEAEAAAKRARFEWWGEVAV